MFTQRKNLTPKLVSCFICGRAALAKREGGMCAPQAVKRVGVRGLFSGLQPALLGTAVSQGVYFYLYSLLRDLAIARKHAAAGTASPRRSREQELPIGVPPPPPLSLATWAVAAPRRTALRVNNIHHSTVHHSTTA